MMTSPAMTVTADACCRGGGLTIPDLLDRLLPTLRPVAGVETVPLAAARGRVLADPLVADQPVPSFARSAVDGYALKAADLPAGRDVVLPVIGRLAAGDVVQDAAGDVVQDAAGDVVQNAADDPVQDAAGGGLPGLPTGPGAVRIFTGAAIPPGYDRVVMQEDCRAQGDTVHVRRVPGAGDNIRGIGDDMAAGQTVFAAGTLLDARHLGVAASLGRVSLPVRRRLRVGVLSTGSELVLPGRPLAPGRIHASNGFVIAALLEQAGFTVVDLGVVADDPALIDRALRAAGGLDALVTSGGVSVGDEDHVRGAVERAGGRIDHWRLAIKPGKPVAVGQLPGPDDPLLFIGLPGNPNAVFVTLALIGLPLLRARAGQPQHRLHPVTVRVQGGWHRSPGRTEYVSAQWLGPGPDGVARARRLGTGGSAQQCALGLSDLLLVLPAEAGSVQDGDLVQALPIDSLV